MTRTTHSVSDDVWLIANPLAGGGRAIRHASLAARFLTRAGIAVRMLHPSSPEESTRAAAAAREVGARAVLACGGDGTVHAVLQALVGGSVPLGVLAAGSGDDIAASLGFDTGSSEASAGEAVQLIAAGGHRQVDVGEIDTADGTRRFFVGVLTTGFDSSVNERANRMPRLAGQRYNAALVRELASFRPLPYRVRMDDDLVEAEGTLVTIGNGSRYGGGMRICPDAVPDDGLLDVTWLGAVSKPTLLRVFPTVYSGRHVEHPAVQTYRARTLEIEAPGQVAYADGERVGELPIRVSIRPAALRVLAPVLTT